MKWIEPSPTLCVTRSGFTLLEVLLTSLLTSVVLVALWSLSDIYLRLFVAGKQQIEETQLIRGLTQQISKDVSQVIQLPANRSESDTAEPSKRQLSSPLQNRTPRASTTQLPSLPGSPLSSGPLVPTPGLSPRELQTPSTLETADRSASKNVPRFGLFGTSQALRLIVLQTDRRTVRDITDLAEVLPQPGQMRPAAASELRTIEYTFSEAGSSVAGASGLQHPTGLLRREWAWETWIGFKMTKRQSSDDSGSADMLPDLQLEWSAEDALAFETDKNLIHVPQVTGLEFQYYDGEAWEAEWNSWERGRLPVLVEVLLQIRVKKETAAADDLLAENADGTSAGGSSSSRSGSGLLTSSLNGDGIVYRRLIHLPFAESNPPVDPRGREDVTPDVARTSIPRGPIQP